MRRLLEGLAAVAALAALVAFFYRALLFTGLILGDYDAFVYFYPLRWYASEAIREGRFPLWNPHLFLGAPFFANLQTGVLYPLNALFLALPTPYAYSASVAGHVLLAGVGMYLFARGSLGVAPLPALVGSATFMFSGFMSGQVGHINQLAVSAWLPLLLATFDEAVRRRSVALATAAGLVGAVQFLAGHAQEWYFSVAALGLFALWRMVVPRASGGGPSRIPGEEAVAAPGLKTAPPGIEPGALPPGPAKASSPGDGAGAGAGVETARPPERVRRRLTLPWCAPEPGQVGSSPGPGHAIACLVVESNGASPANGSRPGVQPSALGTLSSVLSTRHPGPGTQNPESRVRNPAGSPILPLAYLALVGLVEAGLAAVQVLPTMELSAESIRGGGMAYGEAVSFSLPPTTALYTVFPTYPAELFSEYVGYVGVVPLALALLAVTTWARRPVAVFMAGLAALGFFFALGGYNPLFPLFYHWIPGMDMFRVPARWLLVYTFAVSGLAALGAQVAADLGERDRSPGPRPPWKPWGLALVHVGVAILLLSGAAALLALFYYLARPRPDLEVVETWVALAAATLGLVALASLGRRVGWLVVAVLLVATAGELWVAGEKTAVRHPIPAEAFRPERSATSALLADAATRGTPGRLLSFATDQYEVKETPDYQEQYDWIHPDALESFLVNIKLNEALASNLPMEYGIESADGYDGGILPLRRYAELKSLLLPVPGIPADNPLRTNLTHVPPLHLLDLLNLRYVLGMKIQDTQVDNVYYDRGVSMVLEPGQSARLQRVPDGMTTSVGIISSTEGARDWTDGEVAATLTLADSSGRTFRFPLRLGVETAETPERDTENGLPTHRKPRQVPAWPPGDTGADYYVKLHLPDRVRVKDVSVKSELTGASIRIRAITLIDDVAAISAPLVLSDRLDRQLFFDTKLYVNRDLLPRAFVAHGSAVRDDETVLEMLKRPDFALERTVLLAPSPTARALFRTPAPAFHPGEARLRSPRPEEVVVDVATESDGYLVLLDPFFPGWTAEVDGVRAPIERADFFFRGVYVDRGEHTVVFRYEPRSFRLGLWISVASGTLMGLALLALALVRLWRV